MATLHINRGKGWEYIEAYQKNNNWYSKKTNELINRVHIFWIN